MTRQNELHNRPAHIVWHLDAYALFGIISAIAPEIAAKKSFC